MIRFIYKSIYLRLVTGALAGILAWFLTEILFNLRYRYYVLLGQPINYLYAILVGMLLMELIVRNHWLIDKRVPWEKQALRRYLVQTVLDVIITFILIILIRLPLIYLFLPNSLIIFSDEIQVFLLVSFLVMVFDLVELGVFLNESYRTSLADVERFRKENAEYQFEMLKLQLNPHFLFNSLNTLSSLVHDDAGKASEFIRKMSDVYRYVLDNRSKELVSLQDEMDFITSFTYLLGIRFQGMIDFRIDIDEKLMTRRIAPMTVQLLVENAVKHNIASKQRPLRVEITTEKDSLWVINNLQMKDSEITTGVGLKNIANRYAFLTDRKVEILKDDSMFKIKIPLI